ncbi:MAG: TonB-dependent receptor [Pseudomonadota bacterium]
MNLAYIRLAAGLALTTTCAFAQNDNTVDTPTVNAAADEAQPTVSVAKSSEPAVTPPAPVQLQTIVVTGEKLGRTLAETSTSIGVLTREDLQNSSDASMKDAVTEFGNVISASGDREIAIRGIPQGGIGGEGETVSVYLDGVALPARAASFAGPLSTWDLEQVEVMRGAQSTNQGRNSLAGSVVLRSRQPTKNWDARLRAGVMSRDGHDYAIAGGGPFTDTLRFRVSAQDRYDRGDITNITRDEDDAGREKTRNLRAKMLWIPEVLPGYRAQYGYTRSNNEFGDPLHDSSQGERTETSNVRGNEEDLTQLHSFEQSYTFGNGWSVEAISGWSNIDNLYTIDYDRSAAEGGYSDNTVDERVMSQELRLYFEHDDVKAVFGAYYSDTDKATNTTGHDVSTAGGVALLNGTIDSKSMLRTQALFAEADWNFAEAWRLTLGLRYNQERSRRRDVSNLDLTVTAPVPGLPADIPLGVPLPDAVGDLLATLLPDFVPPDYDVAGQRRFSDLLPKIGVTWQAFENASLSISYQEGYRSGGTSVSFFGGSVSPFDPEYTRTVEFATRSHWLAERLMLNANVFYTRWRDQQVTIGETSGFQTTTENAGRSHYYGFEAEALWKVRGPLEVFASIGFLESKFDRFNNDGQDYAGNRFPYAPRQTAGLGFNVREWHGLSGQVSANYIGAYFSDADNDPLSRADSRVLLNARLAYQLSHGFSVAVYGRNLTDNLNLQGALVAGDRLASRYGEARTLGALLEWQM